MKCLHGQAAQDERLDCLTVNARALESFETSRTNSPNDTASSLRGFESSPKLL